VTDKNKPDPKPMPRPVPSRENIERGYQPTGPRLGFQPTTSEAAPINPPSRESGGKK
jgi:hypothetical protein